MKQFEFIVVIFLATIPILNLRAQFPPPAGQPGSTAIHADSSIFVAWASSCEVERGPINILEPSGVLASFGDPAEATGKAEGNSVAVVSLGDAGTAVLQFSSPIADGEGWDFAVFENSLDDTFLELAFVEVSSDGENYFMFPAISLTPGGEQVGSFGEINTELINNMAGKYRQGYGTPFDLSELSGYAGLDIQSISHLRITDAIGCIQNQYAFFDSQGNVVNDPWPTPFETGGFDLDGVGVIHSASEGISELDTRIRVYPNPFAESLHINPPLEGQHFDVEILNSNGRLIHRKESKSPMIIQTSHLPAGLYFIRVKYQEAVITKTILKIE